jgi:hypothetical protein
MARLSQDELARLRHAVQTYDVLRRVVRQVETLHRLVFHRYELDATKFRAAAEEILMADIVMRHRGNFDGVYFALRAAEDAGKKWDQAVADYAASSHAYYTTPLGLLIRRDLFGDAASFVSPQAMQLTAAFQAGPAPESAAAGGSQAGSSGTGAASDGTSGCESSSR